MNIIPNAINAANRSLDVYGVENYYFRFYAFLNEIMKLLKHKFDLIIKI